MLFNLLTHLLLARDIHLLIMQRSNLVKSLLGFKYIGNE